MATAPEASSSRARSRGLVLSALNRPQLPRFAGGVVLIEDFFARQSDTHTMRVILEGRRVMPISNTFVTMRDALERL